MDYNLFIINYRDMYTNLAELKLPDQLPLTHYIMLELAVNEVSMKLSDLNFNAATLMYRVSSYSYRCSRSFY